MLQGGRSVKRKRAGKETRTLIEELPICRQIPKHDHPSKRLPRRVGGQDACDVPGGRTRVRYVACSLSFVRGGLAYHVTISVAPTFHTVALLGLITGGLGSCDVICASATIKQEATAYSVASILVHAVSATMSAHQTEHAPHMDVARIVNTGEGRWWRDDNLVRFPNIPLRSVTQVSL